MDSDIEFEEDEWLEELVEKEKEMDMFYETNVSNVHLYFLYLDKNNNVLYIKKKLYDVNNSVILKDEMIDLIKKNENCLNHLFSLKGLLQYNFSLNIENLNNFIFNPDTFNFLTNLKTIYDVHWKKTISHFNSLNSLYFIFKKKLNTSNKTKKIYISKKDKNKKDKNDKKDKKNKKNKKNKTMKKSKNNFLSIKQSDIIKLK